MTLFITVHKRQSPGAAGILRLSCGQTCQSNGSASQQGRLLFSARLPRHAHWALVAGDWLGGTVSSNGPDALKAAPPALPCYAHENGRHSVVAVPADTQGEVFPQRGVSGRGQSGILLGLSHQRGWVGTTACSVRLERA